MKHNSAKEIALGGVLAALAVVIICAGGLLPSSTFICPMLCIFMVQLVQKICGSRIAWAWYGAVAFLALLLDPDKEAAAIFLFLGYYPIVKPRLDRAKLSWLWKLLLFNGVIAVMYTILIKLFGMDQIAEDYAELGKVMLIVMIVMGNLIFILMDRILGRKNIGRRKYPFGH